MCEIETVILVEVLLLAATGCMYHVKLGKKVGHHSEIKSESHCEKEYKKYCLNCGESYYLVDEVFVACNCTLLYGGEHCEKHMWWTWANFSKSSAL